MNTSTAFLASAPHDPLLEDSSLGEPIFDDSLAQARLVNVAREALTLVQFLKKENEDLKLELAQALARSGVSPSSSHRLTQIPMDESEDFQLGCRAAGFDADSLWLTGRVETHGKRASRIVTVERGSTTVDFAASHCSGTWVEAALRAVRAGVFGGLPH
jgi:hypothetical protein